VVETSRSVRAAYHYGGILEVNCCDVELVAT
jgi:hypothetical protein